MVTTTYDDDCDRGSRTPAAASGSPNAPDPIKLLSRAIRRISASHGVTATLEAIAEEARGLIGAHQAVASRTVDHTWAQTLAAVSLSDQYAAWRDYSAQPDGSGIYARVCERSQPMRMTQSELEAHPSWKGFGDEGERHPPMRGWLAAPLIGRHGQNIGLVQLSDKQDGGDFTEDDENVLVQLAEVAAIAVENALLYESSHEARAQSEQRLREVQAERRQLAEIFRNAPSFMCTLAGPEHIVERANDHYLELIGRRDVIGKPVMAALPEVAGQGFEELLDHVYRTGETYTGRDVPISLRRPSGTGEEEERYVDFVYQPIRDSEGAITGIYVQGVDLTERKRVEQALRESEQRLKEINASLEERVAERTAALEQRAWQLRALTAVLTQAEQRERRRIGDVLHDHLQQLLVAGRIQLDTAANAVENEQAAQGIRRAQDLLDQSIQESRSLTAELIPPVLYDAGLAAALESLGRWMQAHQGLQVTVSASECTDPAGEDLRVLLFQATRELLLNVVKHAGTERAEVTVRRPRRDRLEVTVRDAGRGFDSTRELRPASDHARFGLFGLRERIAWLGGEMTVDSVPGQGTCVTLVVPDDAASEGTAAPAAREPTPRETPGANPPAAERGDSRNATAVVLADDHTIVREGLANALAGEPDIAVLGEAADGQEAVDLVRRVRPDVVVLDVSMPTMSGIEAARTITTEFPSMRVVGLSMHDHADMAAAMREAGAAAYLNKAAAADRLLAVIRGETS